MKRTDTATLVADLCAISDRGWFARMERHKIEAAADRLAELQRRISEAPRMALAVACVVSEPKYALVELTPEELGTLTPEAAK